MSRPAPLDTAEMPVAEDPFGTSPAVRRRRLDSARVRRRRLLAADIGIGVALGVLGLLLARGLAIAALGAILVLAGCGIAAAIRFVRGRVHRRRPARPGARREWRAS